MPHFHDSFFWVHPKILSGWWCLRVQSEITFKVGQFLNKAIRNINQTAETADREDAAAHVSMENSEAATATETATPESE